MNYEARAQTNRRAALWTPLVGVSAGVLLSLTGVGVICVGVFFGFGVGALCSYLAASYRVLFGFVGTFFTSLTCLASATVYNALTGYPMDMFVRELPGVFLVFCGFVCIPGLAGSWAVIAAKRPAA